MATPSAFDFFKHPVYPYELKEDLIVRLDLNFSEKLILCSEDTAATYMLSDISLKYDTIFDERYATVIRKLYTGITPTPHTKVTSIHYQALPKKTLSGRLTVTVCFFLHYKAYC